MESIYKTNLYTVLLLGSSELRSFRLRACWLKAMCALFILLFASAGIGGYLAHKYWRQYTALQEKQYDTEQQLSKMRAQLESLRFMASPSPLALGDIFTSEAFLPETFLPDAPHPAKITNMSLHASSSTQVRLSFNLNNQDQQKILKGQIYLAILTNTGATVEITQVDRAALSFKIRRYKRISTTFTLPPNMTMADVAFVQISLNGDNMPPYSECFPLSV